MGEERGESEIHRSDDLEEWVSKPFFQERCSRLSSVQQSLECILGSVIENFRSEISAVMNNSTKSPHTRCISVIVNPRDTGQWSILHGTE